MPAQRYYTLVTSLPALPYFRKAERLPINRQRLDERLLMLSEEDAAFLAQARSIVEWSAHGAARTESEFVDHYQSFLESDPPPFLQSLIRFRMDLRTVMAALRRRHRGEKSGPSSATWGAGSWVSHIRAHWRSANLKLDHVFPWIPEARAQLESGESDKLEDLLMEIVWKNLDYIPPGSTFGFEAVVAFVFKWDILQRWLTYDPRVARTRFSQLGAQLIATIPSN